MRPWTMCPDPYPNGGQQLGPSLHYTFPIVLPGYIQGRKQSQHHQGRDEWLGNTSSNEKKNC